jgi:hypothetical protein
MQSSAETAAVEREGIGSDGPSAEKAEGVSRSRPGARIADRPTHGWCPACREDSAIAFNGSCLWCGGPTRERKRGGWKRLGLPARDRIEQVKLTCTIHGMAPKHGPRPGYGTYKRRQKRPDQPLCAGTKKQPPRKGEPCQCPAMFGSDYCAQHDPKRQLAVQAHLAKMRRLQPKREMVPMAPFVAWLHEMREELGSYGKVAELTGLHRTAVYRWKSGQDTAGRLKTEISRGVVERALYEAGGSFEDLYGHEAVAA